MQTFSVETSVRVRFSDTDAMGVVWHGNYLRFFEDGREDFGTKYDIRYLDVYHFGYFTPIVKSQVEHKAPINYGEQIKVITRFLPSPAAKIIFEYEIHNLSSGKLAAKGKTTQIFLSVDKRELSLNKPDCWLEWEAKMGLSK